MHDVLPIPLVLVEGFLSATSTIFWGTFQQFLNTTDNIERRPIYFTSVGPVSSLHDRACELYYELKGGRVNYGKAHAREFDHDQYGRDHVGLYPAWSLQNPLHFLGHSMTFCEMGFFGDDGHPDMVLSVTSVSAPFRGTQAVYTLGEKLHGAPAVHSLFIVSLISRTVHILAYLEPVLPTLPFNLHTDARRLTCRQASFVAFLGQLRHSDWAEGRDAAPYDCTFQAADEREGRGEGVVNSGTWYRSHAGVMTLPKQGGTSHHTPSSSSILSPYYLLARLSGAFDFSLLNPHPSWFPLPAKSYPSDLSACETMERGEKCITPGEQMDALGEEYCANDGIVPLFSQWHPRPCSPTHCAHIDMFTKSTPSPGVWHVHHLPGPAHHLTLIPVWLGTRRQREFWTDLGVWLEQVEEGWRKRRNQ